MFFIGVIAFFLWALTNTVDSIAYAITTGDALGGALRVGIPILPLLVLMFLSNKLGDKLESTNSGQTG